MILSDRTIRERLADGGIIIEPLDESCIQPSSVDLHIDRYFRVFRNHTLGLIDVKQNLEELTELIEVADDDPFILHPGEFVLGSTAERVALPDDLVARLEGKALALDTPVPTPKGWRAMGDLRVGDRVFDEHGQPTTIVATTDAMVDRPCAEVSFSDGATVVADLSHLWVTCDKNGRRRADQRVEKVRTTEQIAASVRVRGERNHQVRLAGPVEYPTKELPLDPYLFGIWLGDGTSKTGNITAADEDLRALDVLGNKHVPEEYLQGDVAQRRALLAGLMDSDGFVDEVGRCEFCSINEHLADAVVELAASLGFRPVKAKDRAMLNGIDHGPRYRIRFTPHEPVFRLRRKLERQKSAEARFHRFRAVDDVRPVASVPVRCIQVANPSGMFLVTRSFIPTHNSSLGRLGLLIHSTAGFVDAGWDGQLTLELSNTANLPITLYPGMKIGQISFIQMTTAAERPYGSGELGSKYQHQRGPRPSRYWENFNR